MDGRQGCSFLRRTRPQDPAISGCLYTRHTFHALVALAHSNTGRRRRRIVNLLSAMLYCHERFSPTDRPDLAALWPLGQTLAHQYRAEAEKDGTADMHSMFVQCIMELVFVARQVCPDLLLLLQRGGVGVGGEGGGGSSHLVPGAGTQHKGRGLTKGPGSGKGRCLIGARQGCIGRGRGTPPPPPERPAYAQPQSPWRQVPASMEFVTDSNRPQPLWQPPPTACRAASGVTSEVPSLRMHPWGQGHGSSGARVVVSLSGGSSPTVDLPIHLQPSPWSG